MPQNKAEQREGELIFGPPEKEWPESLRWADRTAICGENESEWITFEEGSQTYLRDMY